MQSTDEWEVTQKLDGSSCSIYWNNGEFGVCSRNLELKETEENSFWQVASHYKMRERLEALGMNICLQGELIGPGIQGNPHALSRIDFFLFDIFDIDKGEYLAPLARSRLVCSLHMIGIRSVPYVETCDMSQFSTVDCILKFASDSPDQLNNNNPAPEGLVFKRIDGKQSFKAISNKYLLREK